MSLPCYVVRQADSYCASPEDRLILVRAPDGSLQIGLGVDRSLSTVISTEPSRGPPKERKLVRQNAFRYRSGPVPGTDRSQS